METGQRSVHRQIQLLDALIRVRHQGELKDKDRLKDTCIRMSTEFGLKDQYKHFFQFF